MGCERAIIPDITLQAIDDRATGLKVLINGQEVDSSKYAIEYSNDYRIKIKGNRNTETLELDIKNIFSTCSLNLRGREVFD